MMVPSLDITLITHNTDNTKIKGIKGSIETLAQSFSARMATFEDKLRKILPAKVSSTASVSRLIQFQ